MTNFQKLLARALDSKTQECLAAEVGVHQSRVSCWRSGKAVPRAEHFAPLATALGVDVATLAKTLGRSRRIRRSILRIAEAP
jgi:transcriptional regulator with XRE-family HTH domain